MNDLTAILHDIERDMSPQAAREPKSELAAIPDSAVRNGSPVYGGGD